jgi:hypothetical protein
MLNRHLVVKKAILFLLIITSFSSVAVAQRITPADLKVLQKKEDSLKLLAKNLIIDSLTAGRMRNDSLFVRTLVRTLQVKNSFYYPLDSVIGISKLYAPDSTFRIFTWALSFDDHYSRQRGAIQFRTPDGSLKLTPLSDISEFTERPLDSVRSRNNWIGAVYYNIIKTEYNNKNYYTLFGIDYHSVRSNKKWIDVLTFDQNNQPVFGGPLFTFERDSVKKPVQHRYAIEYKKDAGALVNYIEEEGMILVDHLISESDEPDKPYTFIPDGDYEGFKWEKGKWVHIDKVFNFKVDMNGVDPYLGNPPVGDPLLDASGNRDEQKLMDKSNKSKAKKKSGS